MIKSLNYIYYRTITSKFWNKKDRGPLAINGSIAFGITLGALIIDIISLYVIVTYGTSLYFDWMYWISGTIGHLLPFFVWSLFVSIFHRLDEKVKLRWSNEPSILRKKRGYLVTLYYIIVWGIWLITLHIIYNVFSG